MSTLKMRRIIGGSDDAEGQLAKLRGLLSAQGNVVSAAGRALTEKVFGEALPPVRVVERICDDVRTKGLAALFHYTQQFDKVSLDADKLCVTPAEMSLAHSSADPKFIEAIRRIRKNIL